MLAIWGGKGRGSSRQSPRNRIATRCQVEGLSSCFFCGSYVTFHPPATLNMQKKSCGVVSHQPGWQLSNPGCGDGGNRGPKGRYGVTGTSLGLSQTEPQCSQTHVLFNTNTIIPKRRARCRQMKDERLDMRAMVRLFLCLYPSLIMFTSLHGSQIILA